MSTHLFTKNFILMFVSNFLICCGFYMLMPIFPIYAQKDLGIDAGYVGIVIGIFSLSAILLRPVAGILLDKVGRMPIYIPALILFAVCSGSYALAGGLISLLFIRIVQGISWSGVGTANSAIVADIVPPHLRGQGMGYFGLSMTLAMAVGPALGTFLADDFSSREIFVVCMAISLTALLAATFVRGIPTVKNTNPITPKDIFEMRALGLCVVEFSFGLVYGSILSYAALHADAEGISGVGYFFIVFAIFVSATRPYAGKFMDRKGPSKILYIGFISLSIGCIFLAFAHNLTLFLIAGFFAGIGSGLVMPTLMTMLVNIVAPSRRGAGTATLFASLDLGIGGGVILLGYIIQYYGYTVMYIFSGLFSLFPLLWFVFFEKSRYDRMHKEIKEKYEAMG